MPVLLVYCACPDQGSADTIAEALVSDGLAACVTHLPGVRSTYRWQGAVQHANEVLLLIKTTRTALAALISRVCALHPYELPEVVAVEAVGGLEPYLAWVNEQTLHA